jgi:hypothetical protein
VLTRYDSTHDELVLYSYMGAVAIMTAVNLYTGELAKVIRCFMLLSRLLCSVLDHATALWRKL